MSLWLCILDSVVSASVNVDRYSVNSASSTLLSYIVITIISNFVDHGKTIALSLTIHLTTSPMSP